MARGGLFVGTSGFAYKEWKPEFYPADLKAADMLRYYAGRLPSVEINNTFYRTPTEKLLRGWSGETPESFVFSLKAPQKITHVARLRDVDEPLDRFLAAASALGPRLGCILFQCPPTLRYAAELLDGFLAGLAGKPFRFALEFRHESWDEPAVARKLAERSVARCAADTDDRDAEVARTAPGFAYLRLRKSAYDEPALARWAKRARELLEDGADVYAYFKHEDDPSGIRFATRLRQLVEQG